MEILIVLLIVSVAFNIFLTIGILRYRRQICQLECEREQERRLNERQWAIHGDTLAND